MKIATWNVNSLKVRLPHLLQWVQGTAPDIIALQETKLDDARFPHAEIEAAGYRSVCSGQKTYNGVAVLARQMITEVITDIPGLEDPQRRILAVTVGDLRVVNLYVVNGQAVGSEKYAYKLDWLSKVTAFLAEQLKCYPDMVVLGDFNITPDDRDVHDPEAWRGAILCSDAERAALQVILKLGFVDSFRTFHNEAGHFSWWDYRQGGFRRNRGLRIDLILLSDALCSRQLAATIDVEPRRWERPSDHAPALLELQA